MPTKPDQWMPFDVRCYLGDTMHLTRDQHGAYLLLLFAYWMRGGPLPSNDNELATIVRASMPEWRRLKPVLQPFFQVVDGRWVQRRADRELAKAEEIIAAKSEAGKAGAKARWQTHSDRNADANGERIADAMAEPMREQWQTDAPLPSPSPVPKEDTKKVKAALRAEAAARPVVEIPDWIPAEAWNGFVEMRRKIRQPLTDRAILLTISALKKMRSTEDIGAVLDQSTMKNYRGVFPVKHEGNSHDKRGKGPSAHDKFNAGAALYLASLSPDPDRPGEGEVGDDADGPGVPLLAPRLLAGSGG